MGERMRKSAVRRMRLLIEAVPSMAIVAVICTTLIGCVVIRSNYPGDHALANSITGRGDTADTPAEEALVQRGFLSRQIYYTAAVQLRTATKGLPHNWAVVLDADGGILDDGQLRLEYARTGHPLKYDYWIDWVKDRSAPMTAGAKYFIDTARELGGKVIIVTNRAASGCPDVRARLVSLDVHVDAVLCAADGVLDKNPRFDDIRNGNAIADAGPLEIKIFIGEQLSDFPNSSAAHPGDVSEFGVRFFLLPALAPIKADGKDAT